MPTTLHLLAHTEVTVTAALPGNMSSSRRALATVAGLTRSHDSHNTSMCRATALLLRNIIAHQATADVPVSHTYVHRSSYLLPPFLTLLCQSDSGYAHHNSHKHHNSESLGDRFRRWFGGGHHSSQSHSGFKSEYVDARTGRPVDKSGRPIYRV